MNKKFKQLLPKAYLDWRAEHFRKYGLFGNYTWEEAEKLTKGYDASILEKGDAFKGLRKSTDIGDSLQVLACLSYISNGSVRVLDFGGGASGYLRRSQTIFEGSSSLGYC